MKIALISVAWNGYGRFIPEWIEYISKSTVQPNEVVICLGEDHGFEDEEYCRELIPDLKIVYDKLPNPNVGRLTNLAIEQTTSEWLMCMDVDDLIMPDAIEIFEKFEKDADYLCIAWKWYHKKKMIYRQSPTPKTIANMKPVQRHKVRINNNSPFRRKLWEAHPFDENNYLNLSFLARAVESGARFVKVPKICVVYRQWHGSLFGSDQWMQIKPEARKANLDLYRRLEKYYEVKK